MTGIQRRLLIHAPDRAFKPPSPAPGISGRLRAAFDALECRAGLAAKTLDDETARLLARDLDQIVGDPGQQGHCRQDYGNDDREAQRRRELVAVLADDE